MRLFSFLLFSTLVGGLFACRTQKDAVKAEQPAIPAGILVESFAAYENSAAVTITSAVIEKNILTLGVSYSGGCEEHEFTLVGSRLIQKSMPPKRGIMLYHNNNGDSCRELINRVLQFDISAFTYDKKEVILVLPGYEGTLSYAYSE